MNNDSYFVNSLSLVAIAMLTCNTKHLVLNRSLGDVGFTSTHIVLHMNVCMTTCNYLPSYYIAMTILDLCYKVQLRLYW